MFNNTLDNRIPELERNIHRKHFKIQISLYLGFLETRILRNAHLRIY